MMYTVKYHAGPYAGQREVQADDADQAIAKVRASVRKSMTLPMYSDGYRVIAEKEDDDGSDTDSC